MSPSRILIFANGVIPDLGKARRLLRSGDAIVCADGGTRHALALGLRPDVVIGDLDSISELDRAGIAPGDTDLRQYPADKDQTDMELALRYALDQEASAILIVGALGKRLDQTIANISLLTDSRLRPLDCRLDDGVEEVFFCRDDSGVRGRIGDIVSLIPWGHSVSGVHTDGLRWPLAGATLYPEKTLAISNEMLAASATVHIESGLLLIIHRRQP